MPSEYYIVFSCFSDKTLFIKKKTKGELEQHILILKLDNNGVQKTVFK